MKGTPLATDFQSEYLKKGKEKAVENALMGKILVAAKMENIYDLYEEEKGALPAERVRQVEVTDALVDTGATYLSLPRRLIEQLGLKHFRIRQARTPTGIVSFDMYGLVRLTVLGRVCHVEV